MFKKILQHKFITGIILLLIIAGGYFGYQWLFGNKSTTQYVTAAVEKGTLIVSISGSGQVSASNQVDIKPKVSGDIVYLGAGVGQEVKSGMLLVQLDSRNAQKAVRDAETAFETAKLELEELLQPADAYSLMQAENALVQAKDSLTKLKFTQESKYQDTQDAIKKAEDNLEKTYEDTFNAIANAFLDLPTIITGLDNVLYSYDIAKSEITINDNSWNISVLVNSVDYNDRSELGKFINSAESNYKTAREKYNKNFENYKNTNRYSDKNIIETLLEETIETTKAMAETVKSETNMFDYWTDYRSQYNLPIYSKITTYQSDLKSYTSKTNSHLSSLLSIQRTIQDTKEAKLNAERDLTEMNQNNPLDLAAAERAIKEKEESLAKLKAGPDDLDIRAKKITIQQREDALITAKQALADHYVRPPFDGVIAKVNVKKGDSVSSGTVAATLITKQKIAEISLNEVDVAKVKVGQKVTLTFDAVEGLNITGGVVEVDTLGTVTQGVVTYNVKIIFDTQDERVKPGMSVSAAIITDIKQDVLLVSNSAIKSTPLEAGLLTGSNGNGQYVEVLTDGTPQSQSVEIGLSNDTMTEITSGLKEGDKVVTQTITSNASQTQSQSSSGLRIPGIGGGGGMR